MSATGVVLTVGSSLFLVGAAVPPEPKRVFSAPLREHLEILNRNRGRWQLMNALMIASVIGTSVGLALFASELARSGDRWRGLAGASAYVIGAVLWIAALAFRNTTTLHVAGTAASTGEIPDWFEPLGEWTGSMYRIYMLLAYAAVVLFGCAILHTNVISRGAGWFGIVYGGALGISFVTGYPKTSFGSVAEIPALIHIATLVFGASLL